MNLFLTAALIFSATMTCEEFDGKCPICKSLGWKSKVDVLFTHRTLMAAFPYYDEDGQYHSGDPNFYETYYRCDKGHSFCRYWVEGSFCWYTWDDDGDSPAPTPTLMPWQKDLLEIVADATAYLQMVRDDLQDYLLLTPTPTPVERLTETPTAPPLPVVGEWCDGVYHTVWFPVAYYDRLNAYDFRGFVESATYYFSAENTTVQLNEDGTISFIVQQDE